MWTPGGQIDHHTFGGMRGGGKGGGGSDNSAMMMEYMMQQQQAQQAAQQAAANTFTDPTTGMVYTNPQDYNQALAADKATADQTAATNESTFQQNRQQAYNDAMQQTIQAFRGQGVDPNNYMSYITPALQQASNSVPDLSTNIASYFPASLGQTILNQATGDQRTQLTNQLNQTFNPTYSANQLPSTIMDPAIQSILGNQFNPLSDQLTNALKRGTLTQTGYDAATAKMNQDRAAAQSQLQSLGQNILTADRSSLDTLASGARSDIANSTLGSNINPADYVSQASNMVNTDVSGFPGALQSAAGNVTFADIQDLLNAGGAVQGATNPTAANPAGAGGTAGTGAIGGAGVPPGVQDQTAMAQSNRGLGSTGAF